MVFTCADCGRSFKRYIPREGITQCHKCIRYLAATDIIQQDLAEKVPQCMHCAIVYPRLVGKLCGPCLDYDSAEDEGTVAPQKHGPGVVNKSGVSQPKGTHRKSAAPTAKADIITLLSDDDDTLQDALAEKRREASARRLSEKEPTGDIPQKTQDYLRKKAKQRTEPKLQAVIIKVTPCLLGEKGTKVGLRVPPETRGIQPDQTLGEALRMVVAMFNDPTSHWLKLYPGKPINIENLIWTFKLGDTNIGPKYMDHFLGAFFEHHAIKPGVYMKKTEITSRLMHICMNVRCEDTETDVEYDSEDLATPKKRPSASASNRNRKRAKVKQEDIERAVKSEPIGDTDSSLEDRHNEIIPAFKLSLSRTLVFSQMITSNNGAFSQNDAKGTLTVLPIRTEEESDDDPDRSCFRLLFDGGEYNAYRYTPAIFHFKPDLELQYLQSLLLQRDFLSSMLELFMEKLNNSQCDPELVPGDIHVPSTFIAILRTTGDTPADLYICQKASETGHDIIQAPADFVDAISHFIFEYTQQERTIVDMKIDVVDDGQKVIIHGGLIHSSTADNGIGDEGHAGLEAFKELHTCDTIYCVSVGCSSFN